VYAASAFIVGREKSRRGGNPNSEGVREEEEGKVDRAMQASQPQWVCSITIQLNYDLV